MAPTAIIFIAILAVLVGIYSATYTEFNVTSNTATYTLNNAQINTGSNAYQNSVSGGNSSSINTSAQITNSQCIPTSSWASQLWCALYNAGTALNDQICSNFGGSIFEACPANPYHNNPLTSNGQVLLNGASNYIANSVGASYQSVSNNQVINNPLADPLNQALVALGVFLGLGIFAGVMGAGILAKTMVLAGLALSLILYMEGQLSVFTGLPSLIWWLINGVFAAVMIVIVWEVFDSGVLS